MKQKLTMKLAISVDVWVFYVALSSIDAVHPGATF